MKVTKENFEEFVKKYVTGNYKAKLKGVKLPKNLNEFKKITKDLYDVELSVDCLAYPVGSFGKNKDYSCKYNIQESQDKYSKGEIYQLWEKKYSQYDGLKVLLDSVFGELSCGGVAGSHYGQTRCDKKTWDRIKNWDKDNTTKLIKESREQDESLKEIFGFNPFA